MVLFFWLENENDNPAFYCSKSTIETPEQFMKSNKS